MRITIINSTIANHDNRQSLRTAIADILTDIERRIRMGNDHGHIERNGQIIGGYDLDGN